MPLPERNAEWPPAEWRDNQALIERSRRWLIGDVSGLDPNSPIDQPAAKRGLLRRRRTQEQPAGSTHPQHVPLPRLIAQTSASLLFGEAPTWVIPEAHEDPGVGDDGQALPPSPNQQRAIETEDRLTELARVDGWTAKLHQSAYVSSGLGGVYLRPLWGTNSNRVKLTIVHHDHAVPTFDYDELVEVVFWRLVETGPSGEELYHLELHEAGRVQHALYTARGGRLSAMADLGAHRATKGLAADKDGWVNIKPIIGDVLLPDYVPNLLPHPVTLDDVIGGADTAGLDDRLAALDEVATAWSSDVRLGKARILISDQFLDRKGPGGGATFDFDRELFSPVAGSALEAEQKLELIQPQVRSEAYQSSKSELVNEISLAAGYNPESIEWTQTGQQLTATEVLARDAKSGETTASKRGYYEPAMANAAYKCLQIDAEVYRSGVEPMRPSIEWPAATEQDMRELASTLNLLNLSGSVSTETKVRMVQGDAWSDAQVQAEVDRLREEQGVGVSDPTGGFV